MPIERTNPFDIGVKYGAVGRGIGNIINAYQTENKAEKSKAELDRLMQEYNNPQSSIFAGLTESGRAYKMARLTADLDPEASKRYYNESVTLKDKEKAQGVNKGIADAFTKGGIRGAGQKLMESDAIQGINVISNANELDSKMKEMASKRNAPEEAKPRFTSNADFETAVKSALKAGTYDKFYAELLDENSRFLSQAPDPKTLDLKRMQTYLKGDVVEGETAQNQINSSGFETTQKQAGAQEAQYNINQGKTVDQNGKQVSKGLPSYLRPQAEKIQSNYYSIAKPLSASVSEADKLSSTLGSGDVKGIRAIASTFIFMKSLDPTSTVRESEFDSVAGASGAYGRFMNLIGQASSGLTITAEQSKEMKALANVWKKAAQLKLKDAKDDAVYVGSQMGIPSWAIVGQDVSGSELKPSESGRF